MKPTRVPLILLFLSSSLAGCIHAPIPSDSTWPPEHYSPRFGLGLDTSNPPPPGRFLENETDLDRLSAFIWKWGPPTLRACGTNNTAGLRTLMEGKWYLNALNLVFDQCRDQHDYTIQAEAQEDERRGVADQRIAAMLIEQRQILNETIQAFSARPWPNNAVDLEVLGWVMRRVVWQDSSFRSAPALADNYTRNHTPGTVEGVYLNIRVPGEGAHVVRDFLTRYPWSPIECKASPASLKELRSQTWELLNATIAKAERLRPTDEDVDLSTNYGRLTQDFRPAMAFLDTHGWWPATLWYEAMVSWSDGYWDHRYDPVLPTAEEAMFLLAKSTNESRDLVKDDQVERTMETIPYFASMWGEYPFWASDVMGLSAYRWTYRNLPCSVNP